jgi:uncharacterized lipoprotein YmbA
MKFILLVVLSLSVFGCSSGSSSNFLELADNQAAQIRKQEIIDFEKARVKKELSDWN